jgi:hypothetical protein
MEMLERRQLLAGVPVGVFSGSLILGGERHHAVVSVNAASDTGLASGTFRADGVGRFQFTGNASNGVLTMVFDGAAGAGSIVASLDATGNSLRGEISDLMGGVRESGTVRLTRQTSAAASSASAPPATLLAESANPMDQNEITGALSGTVRFTGDSADTLGARKRVHAVLHVDSAGSDGLITGSFRLDRIGRFRFSGFLATGDMTSIVFANGSGSGAIVFNRNPNGTLVGSTASGNGKIFAHLAGSDVHGLARLTNGQIALNGSVIFTTSDIMAPASTPFFSGGGTTTPLTDTSGSILDATGGGLTTGTMTDNSGDLFTGTGVSTSTVGSIIDSVGAPIDTIGGGVSVIGSPIDTISSPIDTVGSPIDTIGTPFDTIGSTINTNGSTINTVGSTINTVGSPIDTIGTPM